MEALLISLNDIKTYDRIDPKFSDERFNSYLTRIQQRNLRDFLGDALYEDFMQNLSSEKYQTLLNGAKYEYNNESIRYYGLKPLLIYWWLSVYVREGSMFNTGYGSVEFANNTQQNFQASKEKERTALDHLGMAQKYQNDAIKFLDTNFSTYELWEGKEVKSGVQFTMFKV